MTVVLEGIPQCDQEGMGHVFQDRKFVVGMSHLLLAHHIVLVQGLDCIVFLVELALSQMHTATCACTEGLLEDKVVQSKLAVLVPFHLITSSCG